jgi:hypothetical protein
MSKDNDFLANLCSIDDPEVKQFFAEEGRKSAANYIRKHHITRPPKDEAEALEWARAATEEYINEL